MSMRILILLVVALLLAMLVVGMNASHVTVDLAFWQGDMRLGVALVLCLVVGLVLGVAIRSDWIGSLLRERGRLRRALKAAESRLISGSR